MLNRLLFSLALAFVACTLSAAEKNEDLPNIVVILADDMGYGSVGCYGAPSEIINTPNIDRLATEGMRFTDGNTPSSVCTPTRYGLLTGRYCWRSRLKFGVCNVLDPMLIEPSRPTVASLLKSKGYQCAAIGKWHLGYGLTRPVDFTGQLTPGPRELGFDYHFAVPQNNGDMTGVYVENDRVVGLRSRQRDPNPGTTFYGSKYLGLDAPARDDNQNMPVMTVKAIDWLKQVPPDSPYFLYFAATAVHEPITPSKQVQGTSQAGPYGDFIHDMDRTVGQILKAVQQRGDSDNTLFLFTSDNGGVIPRPQQVQDRNPSIRQAIDAGLAVNGDWRGRKHSIFEGGFRVPFIVRWPAHVRPNQTCHEMVNVVDIFATIADAVGQPLPADESTAEDSVSFLPLLTAQTEPRTRDNMIVHSAHGNFAIRSGPWKYIEGKAHPKVKPGAVRARAEEYGPQLYQLERDPQEQTNCIGDHPEVAARLQRELARVRGE